MNTVETLGHEHFDYLRGHDNAHKHVNHVRIAVTCMNILIVNFMHIEN